MKRTKIVCTIGPSSEDEEILRKLAKAGMNVCRLAFSHGSYSEHAKIIQRLRKIEQELELPIGILQDLQGPRLRIGKLRDEGISVEKGEEVILLGEGLSFEGESAQKFIPLQFKKLYKYVERGQHILINDGLVDMTVEKIVEEKIFCAVKTGGEILTHKGINVPETQFPGPVLTPKDRKDLRFGLEHGIDFVALSFVRSADDIVALRRLLSRYEQRSMKEVCTKIIAKIERREAVENFDEILDVADGIMVARGDLGIELSPSEVPVFQKRAVASCVAAAKPVIVATQMLESMMEHLRPTRAEASDVANAVIDHTDAVMLSGETASGKCPVPAVEMMAKIIRRTERSKYDNMAFKKESLQTLNLLLYSLIQTLEDHKLHNILLIVDSDNLSRLISSLRLEKKIFVACRDFRLARKLTLLWGIQPIVEKIKRNAILGELKQRKVLEENEKILVVDEGKMKNSEIEAVFAVLTV
jgi:pyruvate kinase